MCVCSLSYPPCKAHAPYCHLWHVRLHNIFFLSSHYLINGTIFEKLLNPKCIFRYSLKPFPETFLILRRNDRDIIKNVRWLFLSNFHETWISSTDFSKNILISNFMKIHPLGPEFFLCGRMGRRKHVTTLTFLPAILRTRLKNSM